MIVLYLQALETDGRYEDALSMSRPEIKETMDYTRLHDILIALLNTV
jgi:hypothetical protein